jgi:sorting nexin-1/2
MGSQLTATAHIVYTVQTRVLGGSSSSFRKTSFSVLRRYSHFLWLYETLTTNNPGVIVPSPPEKVALGRFGDDFVEARRLALQNCLQRMVNHPMLVSDPDLRLFLESDTLSVDVRFSEAIAPLGLSGVELIARPPADQAS